MHVISCQGSSAQKSKIRNGHKVRIKHGAGFNVIVSPNTYHIVSRAFMKNKGISLQLSPDELAMNKFPSPEMQEQIMGHKEHMVIPGVTDHINIGGRGLGTGIGDFFKNIGNQIKGGFEQKIINPAKQAIDKYIPKDTQKDIVTGLKFSTPVGLLADVTARMRKGEKLSDITKTYGSELKHLNDQKNKVIKSSPVLTAVYKKAVPALAGLASGAVGTAMGANPFTGALIGAAGAKTADELLKAEGYGLHHVIDAGVHHIKKHMKHLNPIKGGSIGRGHISDFFKNAGKKVRDFAHKNFITPVSEKLETGKQKLSKLHEYVLNNPALGAKIREHGSKLAGLLAKEGVKYFTGSDDFGNLAEDITKDASSAGMQQVGYGEVQKPLKYDKNTPYPVGYGLYTGIQRGRGLAGGGFDSYKSMHDATMGYYNANKNRAIMQDNTIYGQHEAPPIKRYYDSEGEPPSRGYGFKNLNHGKVLHSRGVGFETSNHYNLMRGRGSLMDHSSRLPPALQSQPYGTNFNMQFMLPPQYQKYNDGTNEY